MSPPFGRDATHRRFLKFLAASPVFRVETGSLAEEEGFEPSVRNKPQPRRGQRGARR